MPEYALQELAEVGTVLDQAEHMLICERKLSAAIAGAATVMTVLLFIAPLGMHFALVTTQPIWLQLMGAATLLILGHLALVAERFNVTERGKAKSHHGSAESNRMAGFLFQGQGRLVIAFDKLKKVLLDDQLMDNMCNFALDSERKRQVNKAQAVVDCMAGNNPGFHDLDRKRSRAKQIYEAAMFGGSGPRTNASSLVLDGASVAKPMPRHYRMEKERAASAMGVIYFGRDPGIGRIIAIRTMALSQEFDADETEYVRERFFREAETVGRLKPPSVVTIYDPLEEHALGSTLPEYPVEMINRMLAKDAPLRVQSSEKKAQAIRNCGAIVGTVDVAL